MNWNDIEKVNKKIKTVDVKGKQYAQVNHRILAFREMIPNGSIETEILSNQDGTVYMKATIKDGDGKTLGVGHAYEKEATSFINKTSYIENCETSAVGRALGMLGIGVDTSVASAEEVDTAIKNQAILNMPIQKGQIQMIEMKLEDSQYTMEQILKKYKVKDITELTWEQGQKIIEGLEKENK